MAEIIRYQALRESDHSCFTGSVTVAHEVSRQLAEQLAHADAEATAGESCHTDVSAHTTADGHDISSWASFDDDRGSVPEALARQGLTTWDKTDAAAADASDGW